MVSSERMRTSHARLASAAVLVFLLAIGAMPLAGAHHSGTSSNPGLTVSETITIPVNNYTAYHFFLQSSEQIQYSLQVVSGSNIDLDILPPAGFEEYANHPVVTFHFLQLVENRQTIQGSYVGAIGQVTVVVDNVDLRGATPTGPVTVSVNLSKIGPPAPPLIFFVVMGIVLAVVTILIIWVWTRKKPKAPMTPGYGPVPPPPRP